MLEQRKGVGNEARGVVDRKSGFDVGDLGRNHVLGSRLSKHDQLQLLPNLPSTDASYHLMHRIGTGTSGKLLLYGN